jgi:hypothetical protein
MGFWKSITKPFKWVEKQVVRPVVKAVGDVFEGGRDIIRGTLGAVLSPINAISGALGIENTMFTALFGGPKQGEQQRDLLEGKRTESMLTSEFYAQSREADQNSVRQGMRKERGQYSANQEQGRVMLGSDSQEEEMLGVMEERRRRGTLLGE